MKAFDKDKIFFTSDLHFNHSNIIDFCSRPYANVKEMEEKLIVNWNNKVPEDGIVFILGDVGMIGIAQLEKIMKRLNGTKYFVLGNHDEKLYRKHKERFCALFEAVDHIMHIDVNDGRRVLLCHYPLLCYPGDMNMKTLQLHGHIHSMLGAYSEDISKYNMCKTTTQYDVGVDNNYYTPISYNEILDIVYT